MSHRSITESEAEIKVLQDLSSSRRTILQALATLYCRLAAEDKVDGSSFDISVLDRLASTRVSGLDIKAVVHNPKVEAVVQRILTRDLGEAIEFVAGRIYRNKQQIGTLDKVCIAYTLNEDL